MIFVSAKESLRRERMRRIKLRRMIRALRQALLCRQGHDWQYEWRNERSGAAEAHVLRRRCRRCGREEFQLGWRRENRRWVEWPELCRWMSG